MKNKEIKEEIETENLSYFDLIIGSIPFLGNGYMFSSLLIKLREKKKNEQED